MIGWSVPIRWVRRMQEDGTRRSELESFRQQALATIGDADFESFEGLPSRVGEHLLSIYFGWLLRWTFDPAYVSRLVVYEQVTLSPEGLSYRTARLPPVAQAAVRQCFPRLPERPPPEIAAYLEAFGDLDTQIKGHLQDTLERIAVAKLCGDRLPLLRWDETIDTLTAHYLRRGGGGEGNYEAAAEHAAMAGRTLVYRLKKLRRWGLVGAAGTAIVQPLILPPHRN